MDRGSKHARQIVCRWKSAFYDRSYDYREFYHHRCWARPFYDADAELPPWNLWPVSLRTHFGVIETIDQFNTEQQHTTISRMCCHHIQTPKKKIWRLCCWCWSFNMKFTMFLPRVSTSKSRNSRNYGSFRVLYRPVTWASVLFFLLEWNAGLTIISIAIKYGGRVEIHWILKSVLRFISISFRGMIYLRENILKIMDILEEKRYYSSHSIKSVAVC